MLDPACTQAARWRRCPAGSARSGIAFTSRSASSSAGPRQTIGRGRPAESGLEPSSLSLEITESAPLEEPQGVADDYPLSRLGVRFVLDDFGTGYSSLAYLTGLPIDGLKVDHSFVADLGSDERSTAITTAIVRMAQALASR